MEVRKTKSRALVVVIFMIGIMCSPLWAATSIVGSKHDFSTSNAGGPTPFAGVYQTVDGFGFGVNMDEVCVFCHTPHGASTDSAHGTNTLLWNRTASPPSGFTGYNMYSSATFSVTATAPTGISMMCMSCHDGVTSIAANVGGVGGTPVLINAPGSGNPDVILNDLSNDYVAIGDSYNGGLLGWGANLGNKTRIDSGQIDLSNDHPISFNYPVPSSVLVEPTNPKIKLFGASKRLECATCHTVHDPTNAPFLAIPNTNSDMCRNCHLL